MPLLDTRQGRDLTGTLIVDIVLQVLSYVAQTEREFILQRQAEGITAAKQRGVHFGRKPMERPDSFEAVKQDWEDGKLSSRAAAHFLQISHTTFLRWVKEPVIHSTPCVPMLGDLDINT
jgi:DNA invertase Pin-like site-specific DNA recombinase